MKITISRNDFVKTKREFITVVDERLGAAAFEGERYAKQSMVDSPSTGRSYRHGSVTHIASSPGNAPKIDTGKLVNSIYSTKVKLLKWRVYVEAEYAEYLEFGTRDMEARPFMMPMADYIKTFIKKSFRRIKT